MKLPVEDVIAAARSGSRSPLYEYLLREYETLSPQLVAPVNWAAVAERFRKAGIKAGRGKDVTEKIVRQTWWRVKADRPKRLRDEWKG